MGTAKDGWLPISALAYGLGALRHHSENLLWATFGEWGHQLKNPVRVYHGLIFTAFIDDIHLTADLFLNRNSGFSPVSPDFRCGMKLNSAPVYETRARFLKMQQSTETSRERGGSLP